MLAYFISRNEHVFDGFSINNNLIVLSTILQYTCHSSSKLYINLFLFYLFNLIFSRFLLVTGFAFYIYRLGIYKYQTFN